MAVTRVYLGNPLSTFGMQPIRAIRVGASIGSGAGMSPTLSRGTATQTLISGGVATQRKPRLKSGYQIVWQHLTPSDIDLLLSFFDGRQGGGPYCLVDPSQSNHLPPNVAGMGTVLGAFPEWSPTAGVLSVSTAPGVTGYLSGVAQWTSALTGSILYMGLNNVIDGTWLPPIIPGVAVRASIWAKLVSGSAGLTTAILDGVGGSAPLGTAATGSTVTLSTSVWQEVSVAIASSFSWPSTADYMMPKFTVTSASTPVILLSAPAFVYDSGLNASALNPWVSGVGVPRVLITGDAPTPVGRPGLRDWTMTLQEA